MVTIWLPVVPSETTDSNDSVQQFFKQQKTVDKNPFIHSHFFFISQNYPEFISRILHSFFIIKELFSKITKITLQIPQNFHNVFYNCDIFSIVFSSVPTNFLRSYTKFQLNFFNNFLIFLQNPFSEVSKNLSNISKCSEKFLFF